MIDKEKQLKINNKLVKKEKIAYNNYLDNKPNKWRAWRELIALNNDIMEYTNILGSEYHYNKYKRQHIYKNWIIPSHLKKEDILSAWIAHDVLRYVNGLEVKLYDNWQDKTKKRQQKNILKMIKDNNIKEA